MLAAHLLDADYFPFAYFAHIFRFLPFSFRLFLSIFHLLSIPLSQSKECCIFFVYCVCCEGRTLFIFKKEYFKSIIKWKCCFSSNNLSFKRFPLLFFFLFCSIQHCFAFAFGFAWLIMSLSEHFNGALLKKSLERNIADKLNNNNNDNEKISIKMCEKECEQS